MTVSLNARLDEQVKPIVAAAGLLLTSTLGDTTYVSLKGYRRCQIIIVIADGTTVTGSTITLKQATAVAGTCDDLIGTGAGHDRQRSERREPERFPASPLADSPSHHHDDHDDDILHTRCTTSWT